ncbi:hypothetical protein D9M69_553290 [compost metagenome]
MCSCGRIVNYLNPCCMTRGTTSSSSATRPKALPGRAIQTYGPRGGYADFDGQRYYIRAQIHIIGSYSTHADEKGLVNFVTRMREWPSEVRIVHGEPGDKSNCPMYYVLATNTRGSP